MGATYEERFELMRKQGEAEIQRRHELALEEKRIEVLGRLQQLSSSNEVVIHNDNSTGVVTEAPSISNTITSSNSNTNNNTTSVK